MDFHRREGADKMNTLSKYIDIIIVNANTQANFHFLPYRCNCLTNNSVHYFQMQKEVSVSKQSKNFVLMADSLIKFCFIRITPEM